MRKQLGIFLCGILLCGCSTSKDKSIICNGDVNGAQVTSILKSKGDEVYKEIYEERTDISKIGYNSMEFDESQKQEVLRLVSTRKYDVSKLQNVDGVKLQTMLEGNDFVLTLEINYEEADQEILKKLHFIEGSQLNMGISLEKTMENNMQIGLQCNEKKQ